MVCPPEFWCISKVAVADGIAGIIFVILFVVVIVGGLFIMLSTPADKRKL